LIIFLFAKTKYNFIFKKLFFHKKVKMNCYNDDVCKKRQEEKKYEITKIKTRLANEIEKMTNKRDIQIKKYYYEKQIEKLEEEIKYCKRSREMIKKCN